MTRRSIAKLAAAVILAAGISGCASGFHHPGTPITGVPSTAPPPPPATTGGASG